MKKYLLWGSVALIVALGLILYFNLSSKHTPTEEEKQKIVDHYKTLTETTWHGMWDDKHYLTITFPPIKIHSVDNNKGGSISYEVFAVVRNHNWNTNIIEGSSLYQVGCKSLDSISKEASFPDSRYSLHIANWNTDSLTGNIYIMGGEAYAFTAYSESTFTKKKREIIKNKVHALQQSPFPVCGSYKFYQDGNPARLDVLSSFGRYSCRKVSNGVSGKYVPIDDISFTDSSIVFKLNGAYLCAFTYDIMEDEFVLLPPEKSNTQTGIFTLISGHCSEDGCSFEFKDEKGNMHYVSSIPDSAVVLIENDYEGTEVKQEYLNKKYALKYRMGEVYHESSASANTEMIISEMKLNNQ